MGDKLLVSLLLFLILAQKSTIAQPPKPLPSFKCRTNDTTCQALAGYVSPSTTTLAHIRSLFQVKDLNNLFGVNLLPPSTPENFTIYANQTVKIPFPCRCGNGVGISDKTPQYTVVMNDNLSHIAYDVFSGLLDYNSIFELNKLRDMNMIFVGQMLWIPLACSCDEVEGQKVVHYAHVIAPGSTLNQVAVEFGTSTETLITLNNITDPDKLYAGQVVDVPLKGQVLQNLASPFAVHGDGDDANDLNNAICL
ncbi:unnamed protein product [Amaranthus hypochondriacus]